MCDIVLMQISVFMVTILHCVMTLMYNCYMLLSFDSGCDFARDLEKIEFHLNEGVTQRKLLHGEQSSRNALFCQRASRLFFLCAQILISFLLDALHFFSGATSSEIDFMLVGCYFYLAESRFGVIILVCIFFD